MRKQERTFLRSICPQGLHRLKAAGLDKYLEEYRTQFQAYLEANPDVMEIAKGTTK